MTSVPEKLPLSYAVLSKGRRYGSVPAVHEPRPASAPYRASSAAPAGPAVLATPPRRSFESSALGYGCISSLARRARSSFSQYGDRLICVRYRYDAHRKKRYKTVELIVAERDWEPPRPRYADDQIVGIRVAFADVAVRDRVKQAGGTWNPERRVWQLRYDRVVALGLTAASSTNPHPKVDARVRAERISMQMPGRHPDRDARIHCWMPASRGR